MARLLNRYFHTSLLLTAALDFLLVVATVMGVAMAYASGSGSVLPLTVAHGVSLATCMVFINTASGFYQPNNSLSLSQSCARAIAVTVVALPLAYALFRMLPSVGVDEHAMAVAAAIGVLAVMTRRVYATQTSAKAVGRSRVAVYGTGSAATQVASSLATDPHVEVVGYFAGPNETRPEVAGNDLLGAPGMSLIDLARKHRIDEIVVALAERRGGGMPMRDLLECKIQGIRVTDISSHFEKTLGQIRVDFVNAGWLIFGDGFDQGVLRTTVKRAFDIVGSLVLLAVSLPVICLAALAIKAESRGPLFYRQQRVGFNGRIFEVIKFRSMRVDAEKDGAPRWATHTDDRITRVGRIIRLLRADELPQIVNVLKGDMSLVGPRPERPFFVEQLTRDIPYYAIRHSIKPGVTGWAQVRYHYGATVEDAHQKLQYDLYYVKNHSLVLDLLILLETVVVVLTGKGAR